eukprot:g4728.t1
MISNEAEEIYAHRSSLPIWPLRDQIVETVKTHQCVIIMGEPGSGKTTQIPQFLHESGHFSTGLIGCTQPRRVAAITVARRVALEQSCRLGTTVGYNVRFEDRTSKTTKIKYLTDGMLVQEALHDTLLSSYTLIIIDEAHERSLQSDVILGMLKGLLQCKQRQMKFHFVVMSATLDCVEFSRFLPNAATLIVPGRQHPVQVYYLTSPEDSYLDGVLHTTLQLHLEESAGDILVFLTGEEEIESMGELLRSSYERLKVPEKTPLLVLGIYAAMSPQRQLQVFQSAPKGTRRVILATNIAETSVTIPGVRFVVDSGVVKQRCFNAKTGIDALQVVEVSKAQAKQRSGRAGREAPGKAFRLYMESSYDQLQDFTKPEILRCNLAETTIKLKAMGVWNLMEFEFLNEPPKAALVRSLQLLYSLGALDDQGNITEHPGVMMSRLPIDPALAKILITGFTTGCADEMLSIVSMLSTANLFCESRGANKEEEEEADLSVWRKFMNVSGDHLTLLNVYNRFMEIARKERKQWCSKQSISFKSMTRVLEIRKQLQSRCKELEVSQSSANGDDKTADLCKALISGLFFNAARRQENGKYRMLASGQEFQIHPSSVLNGRNAEFIIFSEIIQTSRVYARQVTRIDPNWLTEIVPSSFKTK